MFLDVHLKIRDFLISKILGFLIRDFDILFVGRSERTKSHNHFCSDSSRNLIVSLDRFSYFLEKPKRSTGKKPTATSKQT